MAYWQVQLALLFVAVVVVESQVLPQVAVVDSQQVLPLEPPRCSKEAQIVMCGGLPLDTPEDQAVYAQCCQLHEPRPLPQAAAAAEAQATASQALAAATTPRPDLDLTPAGRYYEPPNYLWTSTAIVNGRKAATCVAKGSALVPAFSPQQVTVNSVMAPLLTSTQITRVKARGLVLTSRISRALRRRALRLRSWAQPRQEGTGAPATTYLHPGGLMGHVELALMQHRLNSSISPQSGALQSMLSGTAVPPKFYRYNASIVWNPPTDCPIGWVSGAHAMIKVSAKWGGWEESTTMCPASYPKFAPWGICGHISFVEMDAQMVYKQALAYHATRDTHYAQNVFSTVSAWASTNTAWGLSSQNGPLEAGWGVAAMARSLEMLRAVPEFPAAAASFLGWFNTHLKPQMVSYIDVSTAAQVAKGNLNVYGNWHATIAEAWMAVAVLSDDGLLFSKAADLFTATTKNYLRWGRDPAYSAGRTVGECTETLRDIYHSCFGLGALLQTAELAWQQNVDLFSSNGFALVAAMELHARIVNAWDAGKNEALLPPGFKWFESMPKPPAGSNWVFDTGSQLWTARSSNGAVVTTLRDGFKYLLGVKWLPTGWEIGYNHYVGRLGIKLPETAALIRRYPIEYHEFHWGQGTLSHADTAYQLWRPGLSATTLCS